MSEVKSAEKALGKLADFHKKQKELEWERRNKRNAEVDDLISKLGDPKVAEKLRIYRLVEEQFTAIEAEVEREVKNEIEAKRRAKLETSATNVKSLPEKKTLDLKNSGKLLHKARELRMTLAREMEDDQPPLPIKDNLAKLKVERLLKSKEALLSRSTTRTRKAAESSSSPMKGPTERVLFKPRPIDSIPASIAFKKKRTIARNKGGGQYEEFGITLLSKPIIRDITDEDRKTMFKIDKRNVGYVSYEYVENNPFEEKTLSAHVLCGVDISPRQTPFMTKVPIDAKVNNVFEESVVVADNDHDKPDSSIEPSINIIEEQSKPQQIPDVQDAAALEEELNEAKPVEHHDEEDCYSETFEEDDPEELLKEFIPKVMAMHEFNEDDSITDRLSTIPEDPSQATSVDDESNRELLEEGPLSSSSSSKSSSIITSPIIRGASTATRPTNAGDETLNALKNISLSEGPIIPSEDASLQSIANPAELSEGPLAQTDVEPSEKDHLPRPISKVDQAVMVTTMPDLDLSFSEPSNKKASLSSSSSAMAYSSSMSSSSMLASSFKPESELSEGQVVLGTSILSEGEIAPDQVSGYAADTSSDDAIKLYVAKSKSANSSRLSNVKRKASFKPDTTTDSSAKESEDGQMKP
jgi:hypothetical protein